MRGWLLLVASYVFYASWNVYFVALIVFIMLGQRIQLNRYESVGVLVGLLGSVLLLIDLSNPQYKTANVEGQVRVSQLCAPQVSQAIRFPYARDVRRQPDTLRNDHHDGLHQNTQKPNQSRWSSK